LHSIVSGTGCDVAEMAVLLFTLFSMMYGNMKSEL
jgi:hypothetical protein